MLLIDGNSLVHRAFHAIPVLSTRDGIPTNAVYGFTSMLLKLLKETQPDVVVAAFDKGKMTFRHDIEASYKAHRPETPEDLRPQFPLVKAVLEALRIPVIEMEGFEADDIIGTLAAQAEAAGFSCLVVTGDLDTLQLVSPKTSVLVTRKGISEIVPCDEKAVRERFGVAPRQLPDLKSMAGDASDNISGIPGIGPKTAAALLQKHPSLEELLDHAAELPASIRQKLLAYREQALRSKHLANIERTVPLSLDVANLSWPGPDLAAVHKVFQKLEFRSLIKKLNGLAPHPAAPKTQETTLPPAKRIAVPPEAVDRVVADLGRAGTVALSLAAADQGPTACAVCAEVQTVFLAEGPENATALLQGIASLAEPRLSVHDVKRTLHLSIPHGLGPEKFWFDTMLAAYLLNPGATNTIGDVLFEHRGIFLPEEQTSPAEQALAVFLLTPVLEAKLRLQEQECLLREVELPLAAVLQAMESAGIAVDREELAAFSAELGAQIETVAREIFRLAGEEFNINSPRQLGRILFEKMGLKPLKKTKSGYSTDASVLEQLSDHALVAKVLLYRQLVKFKTTYADALLSLMNPATGRLHTTFYQAVTATGRLASAEPNLQNIPIRDPLGRRIRRAFVAGAPENVILSADYSQIELRILAHLSGDPVLVHAFTAGEDIHTRTAAEVFGLPPEAITPELRSRAKVVNFGIVYGMSDYGLAQELKIEPREAHRYIENYFARYTGVKRFIEKTVREAREKGFVTTILNRRRYIPEILSPNRVQRQLGERLAVNTVIQGSAADLIKKAMVDIHRELTKGGYKTLMVLQVHDELLFEAPREELPVVGPLIKEKMEKALNFDVPVTVSLKAGPNWHDVEKIEV
ncbi:MAG: DNA polymerase I [Bacillota bacterium]|nr:DNA polymerase I [Thermoanaerobacteraceae bacterium]